jgi:hypothetical protein
MNTYISLAIFTQIAKLASKCSFLNSDLLIPSTKAMIRVGKRYLETVLSENVFIYLFILLFYSHLL